MESILVFRKRCGHLQVEVVNVESTTYAEVKFRCMEAKELKELCDECKEKFLESLKEGDNVALMEANLFGFQELYGSEKQIRWAIRIRKDAIDTLGDLKLEIPVLMRNELDRQLDFLLARTQVTFFIDNRKILAPSALRDEYRKKVKVYNSTGRL